MYNKDTIKYGINKKYKQSIKNIDYIYGKKETQPDTIYINESGIYYLLIHSRKKKAEIFQKWLYEDVLPTLRKNGSYIMKTKLKKKLNNINKKIGFKK